MDYIKYLLFFIKMKLLGKVNVNSVSHNLFKKIYRHAIELKLERDLILVDGEEFIMIKNMVFLSPPKLFKGTDVVLKTEKHDIQCSNVFYLKDYKKNIIN